LIISEHVENDNSFSIVVNVNTFTTGQIFANLSFIRFFFYQTSISDLYFLLNVFSVCFYFYVVLGGRVYF